MVLRHTPNLSNLCIASAAVEGALKVDQVLWLSAVGSSGAVGLQYLRACRVPFTAGCPRVCCVPQFLWAILAGAVLKAHKLAAGGVVLTGIAGSCKSPARHCASTVVSTSAA
jgi:hypothetical protein